MITKSKAKIMRILCDHLVDIMAVTHPDRVLKIWYRRETPQTIAGFSLFAAERLRLRPGDEYIFIDTLTNNSWTTLYAVNVTADSPLTAMREVTQLLSNKF